MLGPDVGVRPVEVGLLGREQMEVPLAVPSHRRVHAEPPKIDCQLFGGSSPSGPAPGRNQKRSRSGEPGGDGERRLEPRVLVRDVVRDDVDDRADPELARLGDQLLGLVERPEGRVDRPVVDDVVAVVGHRRRVPGVEPESVDAELVQVREPGADAREVADPVAVPVGEAAHVDLVDDCVPPPRASRRGRSSASGRGSRAVAAVVAACVTRRTRIFDNRMQELNEICRISTYLQIAQIVPGRLFADRRQESTASEAPSPSSRGRRSRARRRAPRRSRPPLRSGRRASRPRRARSPRSAGGRSSAAGRCSS